MSLDEKDIKILHSVRFEPKQIHEIVKETKLNRVTVWRHLNRLKDKGFIETKEIKIKYRYKGQVREGKKTYYIANREMIFPIDLAKSTILSSLEKWLEYIYKKGLDSERLHPSHYVFFDIKNDDEAELFLKIIEDKNISRDLFPSILGFLANIREIYRRIESGYIKVKYGEESYNFFNEYRESLILYFSYLLTVNKGVTLNKLKEILNERGLPLDHDLIDIVLRYDLTLEDTILGEIKHDEMKNMLKEIESFLINYKDKYLRLIEGVPKSIKFLIILPSFTQDLIWWASANTLEKIEERSINYFNKYLHDIPLKSAFEEKYYQYLIAHQIMKRKIMRFQKQIKKHLREYD